MITNWRNVATPLKEIFAIFLAPILGLVSVYLVSSVFGGLHWHHVASGLAAQARMLFLLGAGYVYPPMLFAAVPLYYLVKFKTNLPLLPCALCAGAIIGIFWSVFLNGGFFHLKAPLVIAAGIAGALIAVWFWLLIKLPFLRK